MWGWRQKAFPKSWYLYSNIHASFARIEESWLCFYTERDGSNQDCQPCSITCVRWWIFSKSLSGISVIWVVGVAETISGKAYTTVNRILCHHKMDPCVMTVLFYFDVLLTVHLNIILVINQLDAQILFYNKFIRCLYMFRALCAHHQVVKTVLYSLWYHRTCRCEDTRGCVIQFSPTDDEHIVLETCRGM